MLGPWKAFAAILVMAVAPARAAADPLPTCELAWSDRKQTPSVRCLTCHDGTAGLALGPSHPVDVDYAGASARSPDRYVPAAMLSPDVTLVQGKVACVSCHAPRSRHLKHALDPAKLCEACHRL